MSSVKCILCGSSSTLPIEKLNVSALSLLYHKRANVSVDRLFCSPEINLRFCNECGLKFYFPQSIGDGKFYDELQHYPGYYMEEKTEFREAAKWINENDHVLEIGCGNGNFTNFIQFKSYTGLEFSDKAIEQARKNKLNVIKQDIAEHSLSHSEKYDIVCYFQVLEHVENPGIFIQSSLRCLKPGGKLILAVPSEDSFIKDATNSYLNMPPHHASRWTDETLSKIAKLNHIQLLSIYHEPLNKMHVKFYLKTKIYTRLSCLFRVSQKMIDLSFKNKIFYLIAITASYIGSFFINKNKITGGSVLVVYQKCI